MKLPSHNRYDYVPIDRRKDYTWPPAVPPVESEPRPVPKAKYSILLQK